VRVLITRLSAFGDIVHAWPLVEALHRADETAVVAWVVEEQFAALVAAHPGVAQTICVATRRWRRAPWRADVRGEIRRATGDIAAFGADVALDPQGLVKSALWPALAGVPRRIGFSAGHRRERLAGTFYTKAVTPPTVARHVVDCNLALLAPLDVAAASAPTPDGRFLLAGGEDSGARASRTVALLPASGKPGKCWPAGRFGELARRLAAAGWRPLVIVGPQEEALGLRVVAAAGGGAELAPPTSIPELARLLASCRAAVGGDTGPIHLAASLGTPTVAVFLNTDPERNGPRGACVNVVTAARTGARQGRARTGSEGDVTVGEVEAAVAALLT
jgi:heptosyltransferase-1